MDSLRKNPSNQLYKGPSPNSEPETKALISLTQSLENLVCVVSYHSQGEVIYWDCGQKGKLREDTLKLAEAAVSLNNYKTHNSFTAPDATFDDWCVLNLGVPAINIETGLGVCPLNISEFEKIWNGNYLMWAKIAEIF